MSAGYRRTWGIEERSPLALVRAYLETVRGFLAGQAVTYHGSGISYDGARLPGGPAGTPVYLGAGGPEMARLGGELADGVYLSWCTPGSRALDPGSHDRGRSARGPRSGRRTRWRPRSGSASTMTSGPPGGRSRPRCSPTCSAGAARRAAHYRANFERMGFGAEVAELYRMSENGMDRAGIIEAFPDRMLRGLGYFGPAAGAAHAVRQQVAGADIAVVRIVASQPGPAPIRAILDACLPGPAGRPAADLG